LKRAGNNNKKSFELLQYATIIVDTVAVRNYNRAYPGGEMMRIWLIMARKDRLLTQLGVASRVGISRAYYAQLELRQRNPSIQVARSIARLLGFSWILFYEEEPGSDPAG
jgi:putative transcriptional regulator